MSQLERRLISIVLAIGIMAICIVMIFSVKQGQEILDITSTPDTPQLLRSYSPILGSANASVTVVEFLDPGNVGDQAAFTAIKQVLQEFDGQVKFVVRYFPKYINSLLAIKAAEAAREQDKYWEMQELLFNTQEEWGHNQTLQIEKFQSYASEIGLDLDQFIPSFEGTEHSYKIEQDRKDGLALGVTETPAFFINGQRLENLTLGGIRQLVQAQLG